ncbi:MAG: hypothetical protein M1829_002074 [Trizodia sp. TS-e1964]|nr:MAG: hypothetical protein M1829_002074 [Trizodia sp. TS-e1964]
MAHTATRRMEAKAPSESNFDLEGGLIGHNDLIDFATLEQVLEMDEDVVEREFSRGIVYEFFGQAKDTFDDMEKDLTTGDLPSLSALGHFLKGSSATLGLIKVKDSCEKIQHFGARKDESGTKDEPNDEVSLKRIKDTLAILRVDYAEVKKVLEKFYSQ